MTERIRSARVCLAVSPTQAARAARVEVRRPLTHEIRQPVQALRARLSRCRFRRQRRIFLTLASIDFATTAG